MISPRLPLGDYLGNYALAASKNKIFQSIFKYEKINNLCVMRMDHVVDILSKCTYSQLYEFLCYLLPMSPTRLHDDFSKEIDKLSTENLNDVDTEMTGKIIFIGIMELIKNKQINFTCPLSQHHEIINNEVFNTFFSCSEMCQFPVIKLNDIYEQLQTFTLKQIYKFLLDVRPLISSDYSLLLEVMTELFELQVKLNENFIFENTEKYVILKEENEQLKVQNQNFKILEKTYSSLTEEQVQLQNDYNKLTNNGIELIRKMGNDYLNLQSKHFNFCNEVQDKYNKIGILESEKKQLSDENIKIKNKLSEIEKIL